MYRLITAVFNLGVLGYSHHLHFGSHSRGRQACGRGSWLLFIEATPIRSGGRGPWLGYLVECGLVSGRGQLMHSATY